MKPYYAPHIFYLPLGYAISLINQGYSKDQAANMAIRRFAYYGKHNSKRNKYFDNKQFLKHLNRFIHTKDAVLVRKSTKYNRSNR